MNENERRRWGTAITGERLRRRLSKEAAAELAGVTTTTWRRAEGGDRVQDAKLEAIVAALGLDSSADPYDQVHTDGEADVRYASKALSLVNAPLLRQMVSQYAADLARVELESERAAEQADFAKKRVSTARKQLAIAREALADAESREEREAHDRSAAAMTTPDPGPADQPGKRRSDYAVAANEDDELTIEEEQEAEHTT